jgi:hypothetical protein
MTTTAVINAQSFGTSTNVGNGKFSIAAATLQATTTAYVVSVKVAVGAGQPFSPPTCIRVWYTTTTYTVAQADAPLHLGPTARYVDVPLDRPTIIRDSSLEPVTGTSFHCWADAPTLSVASDLTVTLVELP